MHIPTRRAGRHECPTASQHHQTDRNSSASMWGNLTASAAWGRSTSPYVFKDHLSCSHPEHFLSDPSSLLQLYLQLLQQSASPGFR
ncbi:hypothetical protein FQA47_012154 [Oryzias melastigma]|uniref:Uncharacterized protein n=1 Tax=Oryzias melastigma TaxID=30732 RepID=A0A834KY43_ORYME|nr:hypothetical protein FQA47_012154 [Oryzias melastigma]